MKIPPCTIYVLYAAFLFWPSILQKTPADLVELNVHVDVRIGSSCIADTIHSILSKLTITTATIIAAGQD